MGNGPILYWRRDARSIVKQLVSDNNSIDEYTRLEMKDNHKQVRV